MIFFLITILLLVKGDNSGCIVPGVAAPPVCCPGPGSPSVECPVPGARVAVEGYFPGLPGPGASVVTAGARGTVA